MMLLPVRHDDGGFRHFRLFNVDYHLLPSTGHVRRHGRERSREAIRMASLFEFAMTTNTPRHGEPKGRSNPGGNTPHVSNIPLRRHTGRIIRLTAAVLLTGYLFCLPRKMLDAPYATVVTDRRGELLGARIAADGQWRFPPCDTVPYKFERCIIAFEDRYFHYHFGVNPPAIIRAMKQNLKERRIVSGGSTLTMQTIRLSRDGKRTAGEKLIEALLATRI